MGRTWAQTAALVDVKSLTSIAKWLRDPEFVAYRDEIRDRRLERIEARYLGNVEKAFDVVSSVLDGSIRRDEDRAVAARETVDRFLAACLYVAPPAPDFGAP